MCNCTHTDFPLDTNVLGETFNFARTYNYELEKIERQVRVDGIYS